MSEKTRREHAEKLARNRWGRVPDDVLYELKDKPVAVTCTNGKRYAGVLVGASAYQIVIRQDSGLEVLLNKGAIVLMHGSGSG